jgi:hypothetical protein
LKAEGPSVADTEFISGCDAAVRLNLYEAFFGEDAGASRVRFRHMINVPHFVALGGIAAVNKVFAKPILQAEDIMHWPLRDAAVVDAVAGLKARFPQNFSFVGRQGYAASNVFGGIKAPARAARDNPGLRDAEPGIR